MSDARSERALEPAEGLAWRVIDDDVYVFQMEGALTVLEGAVAQHLWEKIDLGGVSRGELLNSMVEAFPVSPDVAESDLDEFLGDLTTAGLLAEASA